MSEKNDIFEEMHEQLLYISEMLGNIETASKQLPRITELLEELLVEQQRTNLAFDNIGEDITFKEEFVCKELSDVDVSLLAGKNLLFLGFRKQDVKKFAEQIAANVTYVPVIDNQGDFASVITNCKENDTLLINCSGIKKSQNMLNFITDVMHDGKLELKLGKGMSAKTISLDIPKLNYIFFETTCFLVPRVLRDAIDCCIWDEKDKKE